MCEGVCGKTSCREDREKCFKWGVNYDYEAACLRGERSAVCCTVFFGVKIHISHHIKGTWSTCQNRTEETKV